MSVPSNSAQGTPEPSSQVLSLVSAFLSAHGFESTTKALRKELKRKAQFTDLETPSEGVDLQSIIESWNNQQAHSSSSEEQSSEESESTTSGSESDSSSATSSDSSDAASEPESEEEEEDTQTKPTKLKKAEASKRDLSPAASSSSDSDADDENEDDTKVKTARKRSATITRKSEAVRSLKRKAASSSPQASSSESESSDDDRPAKRAKVATDSESSSSEDSSSESEEEASESEASSTKSGKNDSSDADTSSSEEEQDGDEKSKPAQLKGLAKLMNAAAEAPSDSSSNTVMGDVVELEENSAEPEDSRLGNSNNSMQALPKKKHVGARPTPLAQLSAHASADAHISNAYKSYDYADRAYNDLSVTRGKGFTKEKNKKKRGSYRGGAIDTGGGKSFKFDD